MQLDHLWLGLSHSYSWRVLKFKHPYNTSLLPIILLWQSYYSSWWAPTGVRSHNSLFLLVVLRFKHLIMIFTLMELAFFVDLPENASGTLYQPSCAIRHATEMSNLMASKHVLVVVSDGGPDHWVTFGSVQVSSLTLFRALDLDMLVCVKTCPYQSWTNVAEQLMSTLNLALQNVSLARASMGDHAESMVKNSWWIKEIILNYAMLIKIQCQCLW